MLKLRPLLTKLTNIWNRMLDDPYADAAIEDFSDNSRSKNYKIILKDGREYVGDDDAWWSCHDNKRAGFLIENGLSGILKSKFIQQHDRENPSELPKWLFKNILK